jgi:hypothetical protein
MFSIVLNNSKEVYEYKRWIIALILAQPSLFKTIVTKK